jgi:hypothetical protein
MAPYLVADAMTKIAPHHSSIEALWKTKWQKPVRLKSGLKLLALGAALVIDF